jgi:nucleoside-diphosphate-sugar epimerase
MEKCALVFGGTGLVGGYLMKRLQAQGYSIHVVSRKTPEGQINIRYIQADLSQANWLSQAHIDFSQFQALFHLAYATHGDEAYNRQVTVSSVKTVLNALADRQSTAPCHFVYVGSMVTFGSQPDGVVSETSPRHPKSEYALHKTEATRIALFPPSNVISTVLHPTGVYDESSKRIAHYRALLADNYVPKTAPLGINNIVYADDVAAAMVQCLARPQQQPAEEYIINGESMPYSDWFAGLEKTVSKKSWLTAPTFMQNMCRGPARKVLNRLRIGCPLHFAASAETPLTQHATYSSAKAAHDFGFKPSVTFTDVCRRIQEYQR